MEIVVTGASKGIGAEIVKYLDAMGNHGIYAISRDEIRLKELDKETSLKTKIFPVDLTAADFAEQSARFFKEQDKIDIIINNAGQLINKAFADCKSEDFLQQYEANVISAVNIVRSLYPKLKKSEHAHVVNISSMGGFQGSSKFPGLSAYSASKGALCTLTECLAEEFIADHISVNALALGAVKTEMLKAAFPALEVGVEPYEMAQFIAEFALSGHRSFNGKILPVSNSTP